MLEAGLWGLAGTATLAVAVNRQVLTSIGLGARPSQSVACASLRHAQLRRSPTRLAAFRPPKPTLVGRRPFHRLRKAGHRIIMTSGRSGPEAQRRSVVATLSPRRWPNARHSRSASDSPPPARQKPAAASASS